MIDEWIDNLDVATIKEGRYWVVSNLGVRIATYHNWGHCFQDAITSNDEGMMGFSVSHYMPLIEPLPPKGT